MAGWCEGNCRARGREEQNRPGGGSDKVPTPTAKPPTCWRRRLAHALIPHSQQDSCEPQQGASTTGSGHRTRSLLLAPAVSPFTGGVAGPQPVVVYLGRNVADRLLSTNGSEPRSRGCHGRRGRREAA
jgi:hypothetical protein